MWYCLTWHPPSVHRLHSQFRAVTDSMFYCTAVFWVCASCVHVLWNDRLPLKTKATLISGFYSWNSITYWINTLFWKIFEQTIQYEMQSIEQLTQLLCASHVLYQYCRGHDWPSRRINIYHIIIYYNKINISRNPKLAKLITRENNTFFLNLHVCFYINASNMSIWLSNHSCAFCNPGQWVGGKSVHSVTAHWEKEQPWSSSPLGSVIIWAALRWELGSGSTPERVIGTLTADQSFIFYY